jgi:hypothetical protein
VSLGITVYVLHGSASRAPGAAPSMATAIAARIVRLRGGMRVLYGVVVESVNVRVLLYTPVRSAWVGPMCWWNATATMPLLNGPG